jgi:hypothetical protein
MELNNYFQTKYGKQHVVKYDVTGIGLVHARTWEAVACSECASLVRHI